MLEAPLLTIARKGLTTTTFADVAETNSGADGGQLTRDRAHRASALGGRTLSIA